MGACISRDSTGSKLELSDINSNVYRVVNVDDDGVALWSGQLGITRTELTLYRKGKDPTRWPLKCLRRYGYDADLFSFEAGRRCTTGEGIYAFRCRRAENLFQTLQSYIQLSTLTDTNRGSISGATGDVLHQSFNSTTSNGTSPGNYILANSQPLSQQFTCGTIDGMETNYLEPIPNTASQLGTVPRLLSRDGNTRLGSIGSSGEPLSPSGSADPHSPGSPNSINNILEVTSLNPLPLNTGSNCNGVSNIYQEFPLRSESNNNREIKRLSLDIPPQETAPSVSHNLATTTSGYKLSGLISINNDKRTMRIESPTTPHPISPTISPNAASLDGSDSSHMYMNIAPGELNSTAAAAASSATAASSVVINGKLIVNIDNQFPQVARNNNNNIFSKQYSNDSSHCYENLEPEDIRPFLTRSHQPRRTSKADVNSKLDYVAAVSSSSSSSIIIDKTSEPNTPTNPKFNYIVLDLDQSHTNPMNFIANNGYISPSKTTPTSGNLFNSAVSSAIAYSPGAQVSNSMLPSAQLSASPFNTLSLLPPESPKKGIFDYATIDFNKTVALSNSTTPSMDCEGSRKTRHSSTAMHSTINTPSHNNSMSD